MYNSLTVNCSEDFTLWILCMDDMTYNLLEKMNLPKITLVSLKQFESPELLKVKIGRSVAEYSWTCASSLIWFLFQKQKEVESMIYLDADLYFFNNPKILIDELGNGDVMITKHRYTKEYDQTATSGKYCVQFMIFKNNHNGLSVLDWWRKACLDWCFAKAEDGKFGDQKYLDDWTTRFSGIRELQHLGGGVAPWNVQQYDFFERSDKIFGHLKNQNDNWPLIFYHFHGFYLMNKDKYLASSSYYISKNVQGSICRSYFEALRNSIKTVNKFDSDFNFGYKRVTTEERLIFLLTYSGFIKFAIKLLNSYKFLKNTMRGTKHRGNAQ